MAIYIQQQTETQVGATHYITADVSLYVYNNNIARIFHTPASSRIMTLSSGPIVVTGD